MKKPDPCPVAKSPVRLRVRHSLRQPEPAEEALDRRAGLDARHIRGHRLRPLMQFYAHRDDCRLHPLHEIGKAGRPLRGFGGLGGLGGGKAGNHSTRPAGAGEQSGRTEAGDGRQQNETARGQE